MSPLQLHQKEAILVLIPVENRSYINVNKQVERVSKKAVEELNSKEVILIFPSIKKDNKTVRVLKTPKTESSIRRVYIPKSVALCLVELKKEQDEVQEALGSEYQDYNLVMAKIGRASCRERV